MRLKTIRHNICLINCTWKILGRILMSFCHFFCSLHLNLYSIWQTKTLHSSNAPVNKSQYLIAFAKLLIDKFEFSEVEINFMIPGQTKYPDRNFGTYKNELRKNEVLDI